MIEIEVRPEVRERPELETALEKLRNKIANFERKNIKSTICIMYTAPDGYWMRAVLVTKEPDGQHKTRRFYWARNKRARYGWRNSE